MSKWNSHHLPRMLKASLTSLKGSIKRCSLWHVATMWLSLLPAVECILHSWPALRSNFFSKEGEQCGKVLWHTYSPGDAKLPPLSCAHDTHNNPEVASVSTYSQSTSSSNQSERSRIGFFLTQKIMLPH